ncbi:MAG: hypothetical protein RI637_03410 [Acidimicrobiia bacterium]|nr:hypothetical protein [Acidimicrobiia bacterium]
MAEFKGTIRLEDGDSLETSLTVDRGRLLVAAGDHEIGNWPVKGLSMERRNGDFRFHVEGEELLIAVADPVGFFVTLGIDEDDSKARRTKKPKGEKRLRRKPRSQPEPVPPPAPKVAATVPVEVAPVVSEIPVEPSPIEASPQAFETPVEPARVDIDIPMELFPVEASPVPFEPPAEPPPPVIVGEVAPRPPAGAPRTETSREAAKQEQAPGAVASLWSRLSLRSKLAGAGAIVLVILGVIAPGLLALLFMVAGLATLFLAIAAKSEGGTFLPPPFFATTAASVGGIALVLLAITIIAVS